MDQWPEPWDSVPPDPAEKEAEKRKKEEAR